MTSLSRLPTTWPNLFRRTVIDLSIITCEVRSRPLVLPSSTVKRSIGASTRELVISKTVTSSPRPMQPSHPRQPRPRPRTCRGPGLLGLPAQPEGSDADTRLRTQAFWCRAPRSDRVATRPPVLPQPGAHRPATRAPAPGSGAHPERLHQKVDQGPHLGREVLAAGVDGVDAELEGAVLRQHLHQGA